MRSVRLSTMFTICVCLLALAPIALVGCEGGDAGSTGVTPASTPSIPDLQQVQVPDVVGMASIDARDALLAVGLNPTWKHYYVLVGGEVGQILEQDPQAGTSVPMLTTVELTFASIADYVPDVIGMSEHDAGWLLGGGQGGPWTSTPVYASTPLSEYWGVVMAQTPAPGVLWGNHPPVTIVVGAEPASAPTVSVPPTVSILTTSTTLASRSGQTTTSTTLSGRGSQ